MSESSERLRIGTRTSELALTQTRAVAAQLQAAHPDLEIEEVHLTTSGDRDQTTPLDAQGGVGLFTKELERALLADECDLAVHSLKDLPTTLPDGLLLGAVPPREQPWDVWISETHPDLLDIESGGIVATGSLRRRAQILHRFPHLEVRGIRGNIDTRIAKYGEHAVGLILAAAGPPPNGSRRHHSSYLWPHRNDSGTGARCTRARVSLRRFSHDSSHRGSRRCTHPRGGHRRAYIHGGVGSGLSLPDRCVGSI